MENVLKCIDSVSFELRNEHNFDWLHRYGKVFCIFDKQDSGNICFGVKEGDHRLFIKYAGAPTVNFVGRYEDVVLRMKRAVSVYEDLKHPNLTKLIEHFEQADGYVSIYEWVDGECMNAHWNFDKYPKHTNPKSPNYRFNLLPLCKKLDCLNTIYGFHKFAAEKGYVAIDFYDGSIMYDFETDRTTICDIELYEKSPYINIMGRMWGSSRFMSPEEFVKGAVIDEVTNVFTMGATAFELLGSNKKRIIEKWKASEKLFYVAQKATSEERGQRYKTINEFCSEWENALI